MAIKKVNVGWGISRNDVKIDLMYCISWYVSWEEEVLLSVSLCCCVVFV